MTAHELAHALLLRPDVPGVVIGYGAAAFVTRAALADGAAVVAVYVERPEAPVFALTPEDARP